MRCIGGDEDGFDFVILDHLFERWIRLAAARFLRQAVAALGNEITDGDDLHIGMILKAEGGGELAHAVADEADPELAIGDALPALGGVGGWRGLLKTLNRLFRAPRRRCDSQR